MFGWLFASIILPLVLATALFVPRSVKDRSDYRFTAQEMMSAAAVNGGPGSGTEGPPFRAASLKRNAAKHYDYSMAADGSGRALSGTLPGLSRDDTGLPRRAEPMEGFREPLGAAPEQGTSLGEGAVLSSAVGPADPEERPSHLLVRVQLAGERGAPPMEGRPDRGPVIYGPLAEAPVRVMPAGATGQGWPNEAEDLTNTQGEASFSLSPAEYWVYVPLGRGIPGRPGALPVGGNLPDGQAVMAWSPVTVGEQETLEVTLTIVIALP